MPEQGMSLEAWRARKGAAAPSSGGGMSLDAWRAQKAQATPAVPRAESRVLNDDLGFTKDPEWVAPQLLPKTPWEQASSFGTRDYFGREAQRTADVEQVRLDEEEAKDAPYRGLIQQFDKSAVGEASGAIGEMLSRSASNVKQGVVQPLQNEWDALNADPLRFMPGRFGKNIAGTWMNALRSALGGVSAPFAPIAASGQIVDEKYGVRDAKTGLPVQGSGTPGLDPYGMNKRKPGILDQIVGMARVPEMGMAGVSAIGRSTADVPRVLMGGDPLDENATPEAAKEIADLGFQAALPFVIPALRGQIAASQRGALARGLAATPEPVRTLADPRSFEAPPSPTQGVLVEPRSGPPPQRAFPQRPAPAPIQPSRMPMVGPEMRGVEPGVGSSPNLPVPQSRPLLSRGEANRLPAVGGVRIPERVPSPVIPTRSGGATEAVPVPTPAPEPFTKGTVRVKPRGAESPVAGTEVTGEAEFGVKKPVVKVRAKLSEVGEPAPSDAATPTTGKPVAPELVPPPGEGTVPTRGERAIEAQGGPEAVAAKTGRVVVEQADGTKLLVAEAERPRAEALAAEGKLAEFVNGEGTSPKPAAPTEAVIARDASGAEVRTVLTDTPEKTASAVAAQEAQGLKVEVVPANEGTMGKVLAERETPAPASAKEPWQMSREEFQRQNPHDPRVGSDPITRGKEFDALPDDADVWVFHATDAATAESMLRNGVRSADKPRTLARERYAAGEEARFSPGNGLGDGLYVGSSPVGVEGYGRRILAIRVKKSQVVVPPEGASLGKTRGLALADSDASVRGDIPAAAIKEVASDGARRYARGHEALVRKALSDGKPVPPEVLAEYPDLAPNAPKIQDGSPAPAPEAPAPASAPRVAPREVTEARVSKLEQTRARLREEFNRRRDALGPVPAEEAAWLERNAKLEALQAEYGQKLRDATREIEAEPSSRKPAPAPKGRLKGPRSPGMRKRGEGGFVDVGAVVKGAGDAAKAVASGAENVIKATIDRFEKDYGKAGRALADELLNVETQKRINVGKVFTDSNREYGKLGRGERAEVSKNLRSWVEGKTVIPAKFAPLVKEVRASLSTMADVLDESGVRVADEGGPRKIHRVGETYFPRAFDQDWLKAIREENKPGHTGPTPLTDEWRAMNGNTTDNPWLPKPTVSRSRLDPSFYSANELPRKFKYPEKALAEDQWAAFEQHVQRSSANAAEHRVFQYRDLAGGGGKSLGRLEQLVEAAAQENKKGENPQAARGAVEDMTLHALGRHESVFGDSWTKKLAEGEALYQSGTKLAVNPFNVAQQISQMVNNATVLGNRMTATFTSKLFVDTMKKLSRLEDPRGPWNEATAKAQRKGVIRPEAYSTALDLTEGTPGKVVQNARRTVRTLSRVSEWLDRLGRLTTAEVAPEALGKLEAGLKAGGKEAAASERFLREVRMSESDIAALRDGTAPEFVRRKFEILLNGMVNIEGGAMMRPKWVNSLDNFAPGAGQIAYRFKNYPVQQMKVAKYAIKEAANGNFRPAVRMATWTIVHGEALAKLREALWGEDEQRKDWDEIIENRDWGALSYRLGQDVALSGTLGMAGSFIPPLMGKDKSGRTMATAEKQMTPPIASSARNYWAAAKDAMGRKTMTEDGPRFRNGRPDRPMDREDAFWQELDELVRREVPAYRTVREHTDDTPTDSRSRKR